MALGTFRAGFSEWNLQELVLGGSWEFQGEGYEVACDQLRL